MSVNLIQGDDVEFSITVTMNGVIYDLALVTAATFSIPLGDGTCLDLTLGSGVDIPNPATGVVEITIDDMQTETLPLGKINVELILEETDKKKTLQFKSGLNVSPRYC